MEQFYKLFLNGFNYLFSLNALPHLALFITFFAILKFTDFAKGLILGFVFSAGVLVNLLLLGFGIFNIETQHILNIITASTLLFALWNFAFNPGQTRRRGGSMSSRYLLAFILGLVHSAYIFELFEAKLSVNQLVNIFGFWSGTFISFVTILILDFVLLWLFLTFLRIKEQSWLLVVTGIAMGMALTIFFTF